MPSYDYRCEANGQVVEVNHKMSELLSTWSEVCENAGIDLGNTPADTPVVRLVAGGQVVKSSNLGDANVPACERPSCCGGVCGMD